MDDAPEAAKPAVELARARGLLLEVDGYRPDSEAVKSFAGRPKTSPLMEAYRRIEAGEAEVAEAWLFCGRWDRSGRLLREGDRKGERPYKMLHVRGHKAYTEAFRVAKVKQDNLRRRESRRARRFARENLYDFQSSSDAGSLMRPDPNQFTEYTPMFNGPFNRQQYWDFFKGIALAFEEWNHNPLAKRIVNVMVQYALGRGFGVSCKNDRLQDDWDQYAHDTRLNYKLRKFWAREYLVNGELLVDHERCISIDSSTIYDIVSDIENPDDILYYQQMFQSYTQTYAGIKVPGVPGSGESLLAKYVIRQIPYDRVIFIRTECLSNEKRGRSILYSILGWLTRLKDLYNAEVIGAIGRASYMYDDTIKGGDGDVSAHAQRYAYSVPPGSIFAHNEAIERKVLAPMTGVSATKDGVGNEILAIIATAVGLPKDYLNIISSSGGSRATAIVGSEPFTKVIEDLQEDLQDLLTQIIEKWCEKQGADFDPEDWQITFPSVAKDSTADVIKNLVVAKEAGAINERNMAEAIASELDRKGYNFEDEVAEGKKDAAAGMTLVPDFGLPATLGQPNTPGPVPQPDGGRAPVPGGATGAKKMAKALPDAGDKNPTFGKGKKKVKDEHKNL